MKKTVFLLTAMLFSVVSAFAQGGTTGPLTWNISGNTLTISGAGAMPDYNNCNGAPWSQYQFNTVIIESGVTQIGSYAFCGSGLQNISIPSNVALIGTYAFRDCAGLGTVTLEEHPNNTALTFTLGNGFITFQGSGITTLNMNRNIAFNFNDASPFKNTSLAYVNIGNRVTNIPNYTFSGCSSISNITSDRCPPPTVFNNTFTGINNSILVDCNCACVTTYTTVWSYFSNFNCEDEPPTIITTTLPNGLLGTAYNQTLTATGTAPITWSVINGNLPNGLNLSGAGIISGTPTEVGTFNFTVQATNSAGSDTKTLSISVLESPTIITTTLPSGTTGTAYNTQLAATGTSPVTWSLASGNLPTGLTLYSGGTISGTPTTVGTFNFIIQASNSAGSDTKSLSISITTSTIAPTITTTTLPDGKTDTAYSAQLEATGTTPISWALTSGNLPAGLILYSGGTISGTPTATGTFNFTVQATNSAGNATKTLAIKIEDGVGVSENEMSGIRVYPNPTTGELIIDNGQLTIENVEIFDFYGRKQKIIVNYQLSIINSINISDLATGIYFLWIKTEQGEVVRKVLKE